MYFNFNLVIYIHISLYLYMYIYLSICTEISIYIFLYIYIYIHVYMYLVFYSYIIYIYIYIYIYMFINSYIETFPTNTNQGNPHRGSRKNEFRQSYPPYKNVSRQMLHKSWLNVTRGAWKRSFAVDSLWP